MKIELGAGDISELITNSQHYGEGFSQIELWEVIDTILAWAETKLPDLDGYELLNMIEHATIVNFDVLFKYFVTEEECGLWDGAPLNAIHPRQLVENIETALKKTRKNLAKVALVNNSINSNRVILIFEPDDL